MALLDLPIVDKTWTEKPPSTLEDIASFIAREGLPQWKLIRQLFNTFVSNLNHGTLQILGVLIRFGSGAPSSADPNGSFYVRTDPPSATTWLYYRFAGAWALFAAGGAAVNSVTAGAGLVNSGTAADPVIDMASAGATLTITANNAEVAAAIVAGAALGTTSVQSVGAGAGLVNSGTATNPVIDAVAANATIVVHPDSIEVGTISSVNVDDSIATEASLEDVDLSIAAVLDALQFQTRILRDIDEKVALRAGRLPFGGDDDSDTVQLMTSLLVSIDNHLADETGTLPFSED